jgi:hypothetical protein
MPGRLRLECRTSPFRFSLLGATRIAGGMLLSGAVLIATLLPVAAVSKGEDGPRPVTKSGTSGPKSPGRELRLHFRLPAGMTLPANFQPQVYVESDRDEARLMWQPEFRRGGLRHANLLPVHATGTGEFEVRLLHPDQPFYVAIHTPGFLRFFERGPFQWSQIKNGRLEIEVERPATLEVHFDPGPDKPEKRPFDGQVLHIFRRTEGTQSYNFFADYDLPFKGLARIADLAAGDYLVGVETRPSRELRTIPGRRVLP